MGISRKVYVVGSDDNALAIANLCRAQPQQMDVALCDERFRLFGDVEHLAHDIVRDRTTKIVFFDPFLAGDTTPLRPLVGQIRRENPTGVLRKDITLVAFSKTSGASAEEQYRRGLDLVKRSGANLVLASDTETGVTMVVAPEESAYHVETDRDKTLAGLVEMVYLRSNLTFTQSTVVAGDPVPWESNEVPASLRTVVDLCIERGAYKRFLGVTAGHFAVRLDDQTFLTSRRRTDFNDMRKIGLVRVRTDGPDTVVAYGSKPSVGGQSQRIVFRDHPGLDCIVHFHCPKREGSAVPTVSQREFECGSHECGQNTSRGLASFGPLKAVFLDNHGPNVVFRRDIDPREVTAFIEANFDLEKKTGGYTIA